MRQPRSKFDIDKIRLKRQYDRRIKISDEDRKKLAELREKDPNFWSYSALASEFAISKKLAIMICRPDIAEKNKEQYKGRRADGRYYNKDKNTKYMREHRAYKRELIKQNKITL